jgi:hypothetical protein
MYTVYQRIEEQNLLSQGFKKENMGYGQLLLATCGIYRHSRHEVHDRSCHEVRDRNGHHEVHVHNSAHVRNSAFRNSTCMQMFDGLQLLETKPALVLLRCL